MNSLIVPERAILIVEERRFYVAYDKQGNAHTFTNNAILADHSIHQPNPDGNPCEFLGNNPCRSDGRTTAQIHNERAIFALLEDSVAHVNAYNAAKG